MVKGTDTEIFDALAAHNYEDGNGQQRTEWLRIGRAFPNSGGGFNVRLRAVPAASNGEVVIVVKKRQPRPED